ncbi:cytidylate kinase [Methyloceanibacter stevinii]|uniref:Cytidylate kinase n=1 Tax=Methyloceanibacter stevinii TaxID=1774970 RepID=A0A1E3VQ40_9HYPH|nr:(d)CMP kinase [Methyloceanibacter stevinii]ODR95637.1 cytidylate kinase [Methyloceanibacter stevinii]
MIIAIDGPAASGKGTLAKRVAVHYGLPHLDTGLLYRAVGRDALARGIALDNAEATAEVASTLEIATLDDPALRTAGAGEAASQVARHPAVRTALLAYQRNFAQGELGAVLDGRDIGTVICPDADAKLFVTATPEVRAMRRFLELTGRGVAITEAAVLADIRARDERDSTRGAAPLVQASDAVLLETTNLSIDAAFRAALDLIEAAMSRAGRAG